MTEESGKGRNPYYEGLFCGEDQDDAYVRRSIARERDELIIDLTACAEAHAVEEQDNERLRAENEALRQDDQRTHGLEEMLFSAGAMKHAPCFCCGYNGPNYFDPKIHKCAERHHKYALRTENEKLRLDYELLSDDYCNLEEDNRRLRSKAAEDENLLAAMRQEIEELHGLRDESEELRKSLKRCLAEAEDWLNEACGGTPEEEIGYDGWADEARRLLDRGEVE